MLELKYDYHSIEAGCDEAGRGCLAGPVFAAAVILPDNFSDELLNDSKQLSEKQRAGLRPVIEREALAWAVASVDNHEIDKINILNASILAMHRALDQLKVRPGHIIVDRGHVLSAPATAGDITQIIMDDLDSHPVSFPDFSDSALADMSRNVRAYEPKQARVVPAEPAPSGPKHREKEERKHKKHRHEK